MGRVRRRGRRSSGISWCALRAPLLLALMGLAGLVLALGATAAPFKDKPPKDDDKHGHKTTTLVTTIESTTTVVVSAPSAPPASAADLSVQTLGAVSTVFAGQNVTYTTVVTNAGPSIATGAYLVDDISGGARVLTSAASRGSCSGTAEIRCSFGSLVSGASAVVTVTFAAPPAATTIMNLAVVGADQADPQSSNNSSRAETVVLAGHAGPPVLSTQGGAFAPPLFARAEGGARVVGTSVILDEAAAISVSVVDSAGRAVTLLAGSRVDYIPSGHPHLTLPRMVDRGRSVPLRLRLKVPAGNRYSIVVRALAPSGDSSSLTIAFRT